MFPEALLKLHTAYFPGMESNKSILPSLVEPIIWHSSPKSDFLSGLDCWRLVPQNIGTELRYDWRMTWVSGALSRLGR